MLNSQHTTLYYVGSICGTDPQNIIPTSAYHLINQNPVKSIYMYKWDAWPTYTLLCLFYHTLLLSKIGVQPSASLFWYWTALLSTCTVCVCMYACMQTQFKHRFLLICQRSTQARMLPLPVCHPNHLHWPPAPNFPTSAQCIRPLPPWPCRQFDWNRWAAFQEPF